MDALITYAGQHLAGAYMIYMGLLVVLGYFGLHAGVLALLLYFKWRRRRLVGRERRRAPHAIIGLELIYGFVNPLVYLLMLAPYAAVRPRKAIDDWIEAVAWTLFVALWGTRILLPRTLELSSMARARLVRLCGLGLVTLAAFALTDLTRAWWPLVSGSGPRIMLPPPVWLLLAFAPLYLIPAVLLDGYRARLAAADSNPGFLLPSRKTSYRLAASMCVLALLTIAVSAFRPSDAATRRRIGQLAPAIANAAIRYDVDPALLAAIVYVTEREQLEPFRDHLERFATTAFLMDAASDFSLSKRFNLSIGVAQIKPITALTALKVCQASGQPWELWFKHLRDVPELGREWQLGPEAVAACQPPLLPVPVNKPEVVSALLRDDDNIAFAAMILGLYRWQWQTASPGWDLSSRPDILATLYQIGFEKSHPHAAPPSNAFGARVAEISRQSWLRERFEGPRLARAQMAEPGR
jgi:hypothetical protein